MKVIIAGGRDFTDYELLKKACNFYLKNTADIEIVSGHAPGADALGEQYAKEKNLLLTIIPADWANFGKAAGPKRNEKMGEYADALIAFWDGKSRGTKNMIELATEKGLKVKVIKY